MVFSSLAEMLDVGIFEIVGSKAVRRESRLLSISTCSLLVLPGCVINSKYLLALAYHSKETTYIDLKFSRPFESLSETMHTSTALFLPLLGAALVSASRYQARSALSLDDEFLDILTRDVQSKEADLTLARRNLDSQLQNTYYRRCMYPLVDPGVMSLP